MLKINKSCYHIVCFCFLGNKSALLDRIIGNYFAEVESAQRLYQHGKYEILDIYGHEVISNPPDNLHTLCNFLGVTCNEDYIEACAKLLYSKPALTKKFRCMDYE